MKSDPTKSRGRPSLEKTDREDLLWMLERWKAGKSGFSVRAISLQAVGLATTSVDHKPKISANDDAKAEKPKPSSVAKRLERRFADLIKQGEALPVSVYRVRNMHLLLLRGGADRPISSENQVLATQRTARELDMSEEEVIEHALRGWAILNDWFPDRHNWPV